MYLLTYFIGYIIAYFCCRSTQSRSELFFPGYEKTRMAVVRRIFYALFAWGFIAVWLFDLLLRWVDRVDWSKNGPKWL